MRSQQWEPRVIMVELRQVFPLFCRVACLATELIAVRPSRSHAFCELAVVDIIMTRCATKLSEVIRGYFGSAQRFVTLVAGHRYVTSVQWKAGLLVHGQCVAGCLKRRAVVASLALVIPGGPGELSCMLVLMAIDAQRELDLKTSVLARWDMARGALHVAVGKDQWKAGLSMIRNGES